jgi:D-alanyl-D-alanine carboxypeptidase-like protein
MSGAFQRLSVSCRGMPGLSGVHCQARSVTTLESVVAQSQNGWPVLESAPPAVTVPGTNVRLTMRPGTVATVLNEVARRFHSEVEPITGGVRDDWGWAFRPVRGQTRGFSNHASGTAIDLNATQHPRGVKNTFTAREEAAVRRILADLRDPQTGRSVVRWGEDYTTTVDGMHFEINADAAAVARVASRIKDHSEDEDMKASDPIHLGPGSRAVLNQPDGVITYEESVALQTAAAVQNVQMLQSFMQEQRQANQQILAELKEIRENQGDNLG